MSQTDLVHALATMSDPASLVRVHEALDTIARRVLSGAREQDRDDIVHEALVKLRKRARPLLGESDDAAWSYLTRTLENSLTDQRRGVRRRIALENELKEMRRPSHRRKGYDDLGGDTTGEEEPHVPATSEGVDRAIAALREHARDAAAEISREQDRASFLATFEELLAIHVCRTVTSDDLVRAEAGQAHEGSAEEAWRQATNRIQQRQTRTRRRLLEHLEALPPASAGDGWSIQDVLIRIVEGLRERRTQG